LISTSKYSCSTSFSVGDVLNIEHLQALHAVDRHGSVRAAADALHLTSSAISQQITRLEREVGHELLERNGRGVRLTDAALLLVERADSMLNLLEQTEADLDDMRSRVAGQLGIAAFPTAARGLMPNVLARLLTSHPELRVTMTELEPQASLPSLVRGDIDIVVAQDWVNAPLGHPDGLERTVLFEDIADIALPPNHRFAKRRTVSLDAMASESWVTWLHGSICHDWLMHTMRTLGHEPVIAHTAAEHETQLALVAAGLGCAVIPRLGRGAVPDGIHLVRATPAPTRTVYALWRAGNARRSSIRAVLDVLRFTRPT
jgi:DNA-binding transcriptional LysR family regulator